MQESGREEHYQGNAQYKAAKAQGCTEGTMDRAGGKKDSTVGALTGDESQQAEGYTREEKGKSHQNMNVSSEVVD
jgi:uncharacterized protein YjbJ (UPF0337 family)